VNVESRILLAEGQHPGAIPCFPNHCTSGFCLPHSHLKTRFPCPRNSSYYRRPPQPEIPFLARMVPEKDSPRAPRLRDWSWPSAPLIICSVQMRNPQRVHMRAQAQLFCILGLEGEGVPEGGIRWLGRQAGTQKCPPPGVGKKSLVERNVTDTSHALNDNKLCGWCMYGSGRPSRWEANE
jgi:hypothetical protein